VSVPLNLGASVQLNASGAGTVSLGPKNGPPRWRVTRVAIKTSRPGQPPVPTFTLYLNSQDDNGFIDNSYDGSFDNSDVDLTVFKGGALIGVWAGGQSGDTATMSLYGEMIS
jgi:hypothetical protein